MGTRLLRPLLPQALPLHWLTFSETRCREGLRQSEAGFGVQGVQCCCGSKDQGVLGRVPGQVVSS